MKEDDAGIEAPPGYLYAGAHEFRARVRNLLPEPLPPAAGGVPIFTTGRADPVQIRLPFDCFIYEVYGSAIPDMSTINVNDLIGGMVFPTALDGRDLFTVDWALNGDTSAYSTDGHQRMMFPASVTVGTRLVPRPMPWFLQRNQRINVRFRSLLNAILPDSEPSILSEAAITFAAVNMNEP